MKAAVWTRYGPPDVLQLREVEKPLPKDNEVLIKIHATTVTAGDCELRRFRFPFLVNIPLRMVLGVFKPQRVTILGQELAGEIEAVGKEVRRFKPGDQVVAITGLHLGTYAEYTCLREDSALDLKPANMSYAEAAAVPLGGLQAYNFLRSAHIQKGEQVLIVGAGGSIGTVGVQLARYYGADVTAVDRGEKLEMLRSIGAEHVIDYTREDFIQNGQSYDVIFDVVGKGSLSKKMRSLKPNGRYLLGNLSPSQMLRGQHNYSDNGRTVILETPRDRSEELAQLKGLIETEVFKTVIDRRYPLEQIVEAHRYVDTGLKAGNVVITVEH